MWPVERHQDVAPDFGIVEAGRPKHWPEILSAPVAVDGEGVADIIADSVPESDWSPLESDSSVDGLGQTEPLEGAVVAQAGVA